MDHSSRVGYVLLSVLHRLPTTHPSCLASACMYMAYIHTYYYCMHQYPSWHTGRFFLQTPCCQAHNSVTQGCCFTNAGTNANDQMRKSIAPQLHALRAFDDEPSQPCGRSFDPRCCSLLGSLVPYTDRLLLLLFARHVILLPLRLAASRSDPARALARYKLPSCSVPNLDAPIQPRENSPTLIGRLRRRAQSSTSEETRESPAKQRASRHLCSSLPGLRACGSPVQVRRQLLVPRIRALHGFRSRPGVLATSLSARELGSLAGASFSALSPGRGA